MSRTLRKKGKTELLDTLKSTNMDSGAIADIRQHKELGLGHTVHCAWRLLGSNESVAVILPDDVILGANPCLQQMVEAHAETGGSIVAAMEVEGASISSFGILDVRDGLGQIVDVRGRVEKPAPGTAPSELAVIGRYVLAPDVMDGLGRVMDEMPSRAVWTARPCCQTWQGRLTVGAGVTLFSPWQARA